MALGGGTYITQNKVLPGGYMNFISAVSSDTSISDRGTAAVGYALDWGETDKITELTASEFMKNSKAVFGYDYTHESLKGLRDIFKNAKKLLIYRLNGNGEKAKNDFATAKYSGIRGNSLSIVIEVSADDTSVFTVKTYLNSKVVDTQTVKNASELTDNGFVVFNTEAELSATAGTVLTGGTNGTVDVAAHQSFLDKAECYAFNAIGVVSEETAVNELYAQYAKRMRDELGVKFKAVVYSTKADYEGVVNVKNSPELVYWTLGVEAGIAVNKSALNKVYDGEFDITADYTQSQLEDAIKNGEFTLHRVGDNLRVLADINSLTTVTDEKGSIFKSNQTVRVIDRIASDIGTVFTEKYLGNVLNDASGRISFWNDIVKILNQLRDIRAIDEFEESDVSVELGDSKDSVVVAINISINGTMAKLYMTAVIS